MTPLLRPIRPTAIAAAVLGTVFAISVVAPPSRAMAADPPFVSSTTLTAAGTQAFGSAVAADGGTIVVGAPETNNYRGAVYVFTKGTSGWTDPKLVATLTASDALPGDEFGHAVAIEGGTIVVGDPQLLRPEFGTRPPPGEGAVYVFNKPATGWADATQSQELTESHGRPADEFGFSVAISGDTIVAGAPGLLDPSRLFSDEGGAQVFTRSASGWTSTPVGKLTVAGATAGDGDGMRVAIDSRTIVLSSLAAAPGLSGGAWVYVEPPNGWTTTATPTATLQPSDLGTFGENFGAGLAVEGDTVFVGAPGNPVTTAGGQGRVYVFDRPYAGWRGTQHEDSWVTAVGAHQFGSSVAVWNGTLAATALEGTYEYAEPEASWVTPIEEAYQPASSTLLNSAVAVTDGMVATGVSTDANGRSIPGAVYLATATDADLSLTRVPANITAPATSAAGATVSYDPPVAQDGDEAPPPVSCSPASGSLFPIGETTVTCTAWDLDDAESPARAQFTVDVQPVSLPITVTGTQPYGGTPTFTASTAAPAGEAFTGTLACTAVTDPPSPLASLGAGSYHLDGSSCSGLSLTGPSSGSYTLSYVGSTFTVAPAPLTVQAPSVTASYGDVPTTFAPAYSGFVLGATAPAVAATCGTTATGASDPGSYPITCSGASDPNYAMTYASGTLTIVRAGTTLTATPQLVLFAPRSGSGMNRVSATLGNEATGRPAVGRTVTFTAHGKTICSARTDASGRATCRISGLTEARIVLSGSFTATFAGDVDYTGSSATSRWLAVGSWTPWR
jgi:hypothetical protein